MPDGRKRLCLYGPTLVAKVVFGGLVLGTKESVTFGTVHFSFGIIVRAPGGAATRRNAQLAQIVVAIFVSPAAHLFAPHTFGAAFLANVTAALLARLHKIPIGATLAHCRGGCVLCPGVLHLP
jgi:hypothetical protein